MKNLLAKHSGYNTMWKNRFCKLYLVPEIHEKLDDRNNGGLDVDDFVDILDLGSELKSRRVKDCFKDVLTVLLERKALTKGEMKEEIKERWARSYPKYDYHYCFTKMELQGMVEREWTPKQQFTVKLSNTFVERMLKLTDSWINLMNKEK